MRLAIDNCSHKSVGAVESGGDTSHASLYCSCQCAGLDGQLLAICAVSRPIDHTSVVGVFFKRETAQIAKAVVGQATTVGQYQPQVFQGGKLLNRAKRKLRATSLPAAKRSLCFSMTAVSDRLRLEI